MQPSEKVFYKQYKKRIEELEARSIDCPNRPASKTEVEMAKRLCEYQDEVYKLKQRIKELEAALDKIAYKISGSSNAKKIAEQALKG